MTYPQIARLLSEIEWAANCAGLDVYADDGAPLAIRTQRRSVVDAEIRYCDEDVIGPKGNIVAAITVDFVIVEGHKFATVDAISEAVKHAEELRAFIGANAALIHEWATLARLVGATHPPAPQHSEEEIDRELHALMDEILGPAVIAIREGRTVGVRR